MNHTKPWNAPLLDKMNSTQGAKGYPAWRASVLRNTEQLDGESAITERNKFCNAGLKQAVYY